MREAVTKDKTRESDEFYVGLAHCGDGSAQDYLMNKYKPLVKLKAREYFIIGADKEDIVQEGMIGLYKAIRDYKEDKSVPFYYFAELCITRQIITAIKAATRQKHQPLNAYISLNKTIYDNESEKIYMETLVSERISNPEELFIGREGKVFIERHITEILSEMECKVLALYLQGKTYQQIARAINKDEKSIDNAIQRLRKKIEKFLQRKS